jgi:dUTP pyrophosphatase
MTPTIKFKLLRPGAKLPHRATSTSGAFDLYAPEAGFVLVGERKPIPLGIAHEIPKGLDFNTEVAAFQLHGLLISRSGLSVKHGVKLFFDPGLIDHDYRGEIILLMTNLGTKTYHWQQHERLAQIAYVPFFMGDVEAVEELTTTDRGEGGLGSTGR